ncbi:MAG: hypothetical protein H6Q11_1029 [Acidobacteria bacterium]|nr:hypothetical protein [Acidobacteriota bacterium]
MASDLPISRWRGAAVLSTTSTTRLRFSSATPSEITCPVVTRARKRMTTDSEASTRSASLPCSAAPLPSVARAATTIPPTTRVRVISVTTAAALRRAPRSRPITSQTVRHAFIAPPPP